MFAIWATKLLKQMKKADKKVVIGGNSFNELHKLYEHMVSSLNGKDPVDIIFKQKEK